jgi:hypothetical protein
MNEPDWKPADLHESTLVEGDERRSEPRFKASGDVRLLIGGPQAVAVPGRVVDASQHGMRVVHMYAALASGTMLKIESGAETFTARVVWNRINSDGVESGFYLL